jgi:ribosomal protein S12 methylthiotransferase accessory factor YcaO
VWRNDQLTSTANPHAGDAVLPALNEALQGEVDGLTAAPRGVELLVEPR